MQIEYEGRILNINPEHSTVPIIFYNNKFIGGYSDLINF